MKVSIVTAVYNSRDTILDAISSVVSQTYQEREHLVIDGASTDGTLDVLEAQRDRIDVLISEPDRGIYDALNKGIRHATGDVIGFLHADDVLAYDRVLEDIAVAFSDPEVDAVYGDLQYVSKDSHRVIRHWRAGEFSPRKLRRGWVPPHPTLYVRKEYYEQLGGFDLSYRIAADYDFMLRLLSLPSIQCRYVPKVLVKMRIGGASNRSLSNILRKSIEDYTVLRANRVGGVGTLVLKNIRKIGQFRCSAY